MKKIYIFTPFLALIVSSVSFAGEVKSDMAALVAKNFYWDKAVSLSGLSYDEISPTLIHTELFGNEKIYYVFNINMSDGFVIVSADDIALPVLGYSDAGCYNLTDHPPALDYLLDLYIDQISFAKTRGITASPETLEMWRTLEKKNPNPVLTRGVSPLLTTTWNQDCYYNGQCPVDAAGPCGRVYAGCGASAMAQHMKYYSHPSIGTGSHSYTHATYGLQSANFGATTYDYSQMPNSITASNTHIAQLMYHCGVAVDMDYGSSGSGLL